MIEVPGFNIFRKLIFAERGKDVKVGDLYVPIGYMGDDARVSPIIHNGIEYLGDGDGKSGYILAVDVATDKELWAVQVFRNRIYWWRGDEYNQRIFMSDLSVDENALVIEVERSHCYRLDVSTKKVRKQRCVRSDPN